MKISAVHITELTLIILCSFQKPCSFLDIFFSYVNIKNAHIPGHRQNKPMLWVFIVLVRTQGIIWYTFYFDPLKSLDLQS